MSYRWTDEDLTASDIGYDFARLAEVFAIIALVTGILTLALLR